MPFTLSVRTAGTTGGAPVYAEDAEPVTPSAEPSEPATPQDDQPADQSNAAGNNDGGGAGLVVGGLGLLALAAAGYLVYWSRATST